MAKNVRTVAIIGTNGLPARYGGFETLTHHLTKNLADDYNFVVYCSKTKAEERLESFNGARLIYLPLKANGWQSVLYDIITIIHAWFHFDKLLILGSSGALILPFKVFFKKRIVLNIGGIDWGRSKWSYLVQKYIQLSEKICVRFSDVVITDNAHIQALYKQYYNVESELIEYGGDHVVRAQLTEGAIAKYPFLKEKYILSVSRAQSDNNLHMLLDAFETMPDYKLVLISNWHTSKYGEDLKQKFLNKFDNIVILDAIYNQEELDIIRSTASLYIHSHSFCGTAPSLVEAMNLELPIICYKAQTNVETTEGKSYYFQNEGELKELIDSVFSNEKLVQLGKDMKAIADRRYTWSRIAQKYKACLGI